VPVIVRSYAMYRPAATFAYAAFAFLAVGAGLIGRFLYFYVQDPTRSGHAQSLVLGVGCVVLSFVVGIAAMLGELLAANRRLLEESLLHLRRLDAQASIRAMREGEAIDGVVTTGAAPWRRGAAP
jgi:hypothetical protein